MSLLYLFFAYLILLVPLCFAINGYVSCIRGRTLELDDLLKSRKDLDLNSWKFKSRDRMGLPHFGIMYWYIGVKDNKAD